MASQSNNDFLPELIALVCTWFIIAIAAQQHVLADIFGNNWFFTVTDNVTTYITHLLFARLTFSFLCAQVFSRSNIHYVGLTQLSRNEIYEIIAVYSVMALFVALF